MEWTTNPRWSSLSPDDARPLCAAISGREPPFVLIYFTNCGSACRIGGRSYWGPIAPAKISGGLKFAASRKTREIIVEMQRHAEDSERLARD